MKVIALIASAFMALAVVLPSQLLADDKKPTRDVEGYTWVTSGTCSVKCTDTRTREATREDDQTRGFTWETTGTCSVRCGD